VLDYAGDSLGIIIMQHYGWDRIRRIDNQWWSSNMRDMEINALCRRDNGSQTPDPYNVIAIFSGHGHDWEATRIYAGLDANGDSVQFDNLSLRASGSCSPNGYGFSIAKLHGNDNPPRMFLYTRTSTAWCGPRGERRSHGMD